MAGSPTERTLRVLRAEGWLCAVVERWNAHVGVRQDLFGWIDVLALRPGETLAVQTTDATSVSKRVAKIRASPHLTRVLAAGWQVAVHGWSRPTKRRRRWSQRIVRIEAEGLVETNLVRIAERAARAPRSTGQVEIAFG